MPDHDGKVQVATAMSARMTRAGRYLRETNEPGTERHLVGQFLFSLAPIVTEQIGSGRGMGHAGIVLHNLLNTIEKNEGR